MHVFEQVATYLVHDSDDPIGEVEFLLKDLYFGKGEDKSIFKEYEDIIEITEKRFGECTGVNKEKSEVK
tara:strand:+ start:1812 stop:2018 length:207 start_codon:yes stop_codon:yes gene_type:complete